MWRSPGHFLLTARYVEIVVVVIIYFDVVVCVVVFDVIIYQSDSIRVYTGCYS